MNRDKMTEALKPCPFCGGDNVSVHGPYGWLRQFCIIHSCSRFHTVPQEFAQGFNSKNAAIEAWNTFAQSPDPAMMRRAAFNSPEYKYNLPDPATVALQEEVELLREHAGDLTVMYARAVPKDLLVKAAARIEHLQSENERLREVEKTFYYLAKWVERGLFDKQATNPQNALECIAHHPGMPWKNGRWDVDHKPYAAAFYAKFPKAAALSAPKEEGNASSLSEADCIRCWEAEGSSPFTRRMFLCPECGNKRCPKATDHRNACTGSNEFGQHGSDYA